MEKDINITRDLLVHYSYLDCWIAIILLQKSADMLIEVLGNSNMVVLL